MGYFDDLDNDPALQQQYAPPNGNTGINGGAQYPSGPQPAAAPESVGHDGITAGGLSREAFRDAWMGQGQMTPQQADQWLAANGARQVNGRNGTWITPHGESLDLQGGRAGALERGGMIKPIWGGAGDGPGGGMPPPPQTPQTPQTPGSWAYPEGPGMRPPQTGGLEPPIGQGSWVYPEGSGMRPPQTGGPEPPIGGGGGWGGGWTPPPGLAAPAPFVAPTAADMAQDPGYQTRLNQGQQALLHGRAAQGVLRGGASAKALTDYNQGMASQEYGNVYNRRLGENTNAFNQYLGQGNLGLGYGNLGLGYGNLGLGERQAANQLELGRGNLRLGYGNLGLGERQAANAFTLGQGNLELGRTQAANAYSLGQGNLGLGWAGQQAANQQQDWYQRYGFPIGIGANAANNAANNAGGYGANSGNNANGIGTARANGTIGAGNAWGGAAAGVGSAVGGAVGYYADPYGYYGRYGQR